jgi:hypothetical protein
MGTETEERGDGPLPDEAAIAPAEPEKKPEPAPEPAPEAGDETTTEPEASGDPPAPEGGDGDDAADGDGDEGEGRETRSQRRSRQRRETIQRLESQNAALSSQVQRLTERLEKLEAPKPDDYENPDDYTAAAAAHATRKANLEDQIEEGKENLKGLSSASEEVRADAFKDASADARKRYADFDKVALGDHWKPTPIMMDVILDSDRSADLAYYLGANPEEADRISRLSPGRQAAELGKIEASKLPDLTPKPKPQTKAPPPIEPIKPAAPTAEKSPAEMTPAEYRAWRTRKTA